MYLPELYPRPTIQPRSAAHRTKQVLVDFLFISVFVFVHMLLKWTAHSCTGVSVEWLIECHQFVLICRGVGSREQSERGRVPIREIFTDILQTAAIRTFKIYSHYLQLHQMYIL